MQANPKFAATSFLSLFADDFGRPDELAPVAEGAEGAEATAPTPVQYSLSDIETSYANGLHAGAAAAEAAARRQTEATLQILMAELGTLGAESQQAAEAAATALAGLLLGAFARFFPELCRRFGPAEVVATTRMILARLHNEPEIIIRASAPTTNALDRLFAEHPFDSQTKITLVPTDAMPPGDVSMRWSEGGATRDTGQLWIEINEVLALNGLDEVNIPLPHPQIAQQQEAAHG